MNKDKKASDMSIQQPPCRGVVQWSVGFASIQACPLHFCFYFHCVFIVAPRLYIKEEIVAEGLDDASEEK